MNKIGIKYTTSDFTRAMAMLVVHVNNDYFLQLKNTRTFCESLFKKLKWEAGPDITTCSHISKLYYESKAFMRIDISFFNFEI